MKRVPEFQAVLKQFPWARIEPDGSFSHDVLRARHGVLGSGLAFGYWSVPRGMQSHGASASNMQAMQNLLKLNPRDLLRQMQTRAPTKPYVYGEVLLGSEWPTDVEGWNMKDHEAYVPRLFFTDEVPPPERPRPGQIKDWMSWYAWRGLSLESPVALLMDFPLSVYHLLVDILKVVRPDNGPGKRQSLDVHYIGTEIELNYLPIFSELALLLPYTDITLTLFGESVYELVQTARKNHPGSLATQDIVWSYTAPKKTGQGSIKIKLYPDAKLWDRHVLVGIGSEPDAMVALDAGLMAYPTWQEPIQMSTVLNIPFAVTEYAEQSMDVCARNLPDMRAMFASSILGMSGMPPSYIANLRKYHPHPITINPFHRPGQRPVAPYRLPNYYNGFAMPVVLKD
ncbi:hypothetical protein BOTBODRAFT_113878 [Botryobasidium botryosum FD-172 SS1]|uniref:Mitochondrial splicing suppressor 51-like C-terminal domain-containing protein n=1 Tax=Botryobasidium botryosum (strain FD-172 SS1) TaxID=930990 RepID=A0A067M7R2_BOTB1|nr:hypothetical protein BOTBODRAFT_113878 [Botryobasidium botryosum FD-172 SS1]